MTNLIVSAASLVGETEVQSARLGARFGRLDLLSKLALVAVDSLGLDFETRLRHRVGICLAARAGSLSTDVEYWRRREAPGGLSPTLFAYTLPSAALGEIAIRYRLTGPNLCLVGRQTSLLTEAGELIRQGEADACVCVWCDAVTPAAAELLGEEPSARAGALFVERGGQGLHKLEENDRDIESVCVLLCARKPAR
jgi:3-oxoacyl-(acyl-carrier-protein) synthase